MRLSKLTPILAAACLAASASVACAASAPTQDKAAAPAFCQSLVPTDKNYEVLKFECDQLAQVHAAVAGLKQAVDTIGQAVGAASKAVDGVNKSLEDGLRK